MDLEIKNWEDFNNMSVRVKICEKNYNGILIKQNNFLVLRIDILNEITTWTGDIKNFPLLTGKLISSNEKITFLDCQYNGKSCSGLDKILKATVDYRVDRVILGKSLTIEQCKNIKSYTVEYNAIDCFTNSRPYISNNSCLEYKGNFNCYDIHLRDSKISIVFSFGEKHSDSSFVIQRYTSVVFNHNKRISMDEVLHNIYKFRNFLMILLKKGIIVEKQYIFLGKSQYQIFDCGDNILVDINENLEDHLNHRCLKIEDITNLSEIAQNFFDNYDRLYPLIELYYNVTQFEIPSLVRFVNAVTMLEYFSRNFDFSSALQLTKNNRPNRNDPEYKCMVLSLINNINSVYNFTSNEIETIAENIKHARDKYIHYLNKNSTKELTYQQQFCYSYFMQDIILLNIYKIIGLELTSYKYITFEDFYYNKENLL